MHVIPASASASTAAALSQFEQAVDQLEACAPAPRVAQRLLALLQDGQAPLAEVERALAVDGGLVVRVLRLASSPVFAARQVTSLRFAVQALGSAQLCRVVCAAQLASGGSPFTRKLWAYALRVACVSDELARHAAPRPTADPFLCGLLHDVGTMALERFLGPRYLAAGFAPGDDAQLEIERATFGFDHCDLGAMIAARWQLFPELELVAAQGLDDLQARQPRQHEIDRDVGRLELPRQGDALEPVAGDAQHRQAGGGARAYLLKPIAFTKLVELLSASLPAAERAANA